MNEALYNHIKILERQLHSSEVRADSDKLDDLLHDTFKEIGRSGRVYTKSDILDNLSIGKGFFEIVSEQFQFKALSESIVLVTYYSYHLKNNAISYRAMRSSVWIFEQGRWQMIYHQGTPI